MAAVFRAAPAKRITIAMGDYTRTFEDHWAMIDVGAGVVDVYNGPGTAHVTTAPIGVTVIEWVSVVEPVLATDTRGSDATGA